MHMKVILVQDQANLGQKGELKEVAAGYARNFLIPKGIAVEATPGVMKTFKSKMEIIERKSAKEEQAAREIADKLSGKIFTIKAKVGETGKLFGSVTSSDLSAVLEKAGFHIDKKKIDLEDHIKELGEYEVPVKLHQAVHVPVKLVVEAEE